MTTTTLALDLGTQTGWAIANGKKVIQSGVDDLSVTKFDSYGQTFVNFKHLLRRLHKRHNFDTVYYEAVRKHIATDAAHKYGGFMAALQTFCLEREIEFKGVPVQTIKKSFTGKGNADKLAMLREAANRGHTPADDNEADAIAIAYYILQNSLDAKPQTIPDGNSSPSRN